MFSNNANLYKYLWNISSNYTIYSIVSICTAHPILCIHVPRTSISQRLPPLLSGNMRARTKQCDLISQTGATVNFI